jgi:hypothetical protein
LVKELDVKTKIATETKEICQKETDSA